MSIFITNFATEYIIRYMNRRIVATIMLVFTLAVALAAKKGFTLVIDAGHGGHDAGALGTFSKEKNINLNVALAF